MEEENRPHRKSQFKCRLWEVGMKTIVSCMLGATMIYLVLVFICVLVALGGVDANEAFAVTIDIDDSVESAVKVFVDNVLTITVNGESFHEELHDHGCLG
jgi:hypothetical protein